MVQVIVCKQTTHYLIMLSLYIVKGYSGITILIELKITVEYHPRKLLQAKQKSDFFSSCTKIHCCKLHGQIIMFCNFHVNLFLVIKFGDRYFLYKKHNPI